MTITTETIDATIATLRETRDGLLVTEEAEKKQHDDKVVGFVKIAHEWADKNGMNESVEGMLEELGLPGRPPHREIEIGNSGYVGLHLTLPYGTSALTGSTLAQVADRHDEPITVYQRRYFSTLISLGRVAGDHCVCDFDRVIDNYTLCNRIDTSVENEFIVTLEAEFSCDSPTCHHGYPDEPLATGEANQSCTISGHPAVEHIHYRTPGSPAWQYSSDLGRRRTGTLQQAGTFTHTVTETESGDTATGLKTYTRSEHPELFMFLPGGAQTAVVYVADGGRALAVLDAAGWRFDASDRRGAGEGLPESLIGERYCYWIDEEQWMAQVERDSAAVPVESDASNQPCTISHHQDRIDIEHRHFVNAVGETPEGSVGFASDLTFNDTSHGTRRRLSGTFGGPVTNQPCTISSHPHREHKHFRYPNGDITHSMLDYDDSEASGSRVPGTFGGTPLTNQSCPVSGHPNGEHLHVSDHTGHLMHARLDFETPYDWTQAPGTFLKPETSLNDLF